MEGFPINDYSTNNYYYYTNDSICCKHTYGKFRKY